MQPQRPTTGFSLIELLVVISIIAVLAAMLLPTIGLVKNLARTSGCMGNLRQIGMAYMLYAHEHDESLANKATGLNWLNPDPNQFVDYIATTDRTWRCTESRLSGNGWPYYVNWRFTNAGSISAQFPGFTAVPMNRLARRGEAMLVADLDSGSKGGYHRNYSCAVMADASVISRRDSSLLGPYSDVITWKDPGPTMASEYICVRGDQKLKGFTY